MGNQNNMVQPAQLAVVVNDIDCEKSVLGTIMSNEHIYEQVAEYLDEDCFYDESNKEIFKAIKRLCDGSDKHEEPNLLTVYAELQAMGSSIPPYVLADILNEKNYSNYVTLAIRLHDLSLRRKFWLLGQQMIQYGLDETTSIEQMFKIVDDKINNEFEKKDNTVSDMSVFVKQLFDDIENNLSGKKEMSGTYSGFTVIDSKGGLQPTDLIIVAGETSMGKTAFAMSIVRNTIMAGNKVAIYSKEMTGKQIAARIISMETGCIPSSDILYSTHLSDEQLKEIMDASSRIDKSSVLIDERSTSSLESVIMSIRGMVRKQGVCGVVIDYLQLFDSDQPKETREQFIGRATRRFKNIAKDLKIWVILISQLNRADNPYPTLSRLRESGQIADASDVIFLLFRPEYYTGRDIRFPDPYDNEDIKGKALVDVAKGRNIGTRKFLCRFNPNIVYFSDLSAEERQEVAKAEMAVPEDKDAPF